MKATKKQMKDELAAVERKILTFQKIRACGKVNRCIVGKIDRMLARRDILRRALKLTR